MAGYCRLTFELTRAAYARTSPHDSNGAASLLNELLALTAENKMDAESAYDKYRATVKLEAAKIKRLLEVSQAALWAKAIAIEAFDGKHEGVETFRAGDKFGFSELLVNQCIEYAMRAYGGGYAQDEVEKRAWQRGYEAARSEFAKATGLYTDDDIER